MASLHPSDIAVTSLLLGQSAFYASGHSNSFASFDLTNGFNGIETSRAVAVALQALLSNYFGPVWWSLSSLRMLLAWQEARHLASPTQSVELVVSPQIHLNGRVEEQNASQGLSKTPGGAGLPSTGSFPGSAWMRLYLVSQASLRILGS